MLESIMLIALGFLTATLFALIAIQFVWRRAVKVTTRNLSSNLDLDDLKAQAERASALDVTLQEKHSQIIELSDKNAQAEVTLANARREIDTLSQALVQLQASHADARAEAETHLHNLTLLHTRIEELETAAHNDMEKRNHVEAQLKSLGEKALQLVADMNAVAADFGNAAPETKAALTHADAPIKLMPFPADEPDDQDNAELPDLAKIKASLTDMDETEFSDDQNSGDSNKPEASSHAAETYLADRIRALEAGVRAPA